MPFPAAMNHSSALDFRSDFAQSSKPEAAPGTTFDFLRLPEELREEIYIIIFTRRRKKYPRPDPFSRYQDRPHEPDIRAVSTAIRAEALPLFYHLYELQIYVLAVPSIKQQPRITFGSEWWRNIPLQKFSWLRHIKISFQDSFLYFGRPLSIELRIRLFTRNGKHQYSLDSFADIRNWGASDPRRRQACSVHVYLKHIEEVVGEMRATAVTVLDWLTSDEKFGNWTPADFKRLVEWSGDIMH